MDDDRSGRWKDKSEKVARWRVLPDGRVEIVYTSNAKAYPYGPERVRVLGRSDRMVADSHQLIEVDGVIWTNATEVCTFTGYGEAWARIFYKTRNGESQSLQAASKVRVVPNAAGRPEVADVLAYWRGIVSRLPDDDPLRPVYDSLGFVHPESALARYLVGAPIESTPLAAAPIYPFRCNLSQRQAVENALTNAVSVIEGPPGTGKTETILNLVANIIASGTQTVGVVSFGNSAVDNVRDKLDELGFGPVIARLGNKDMATAFFDGQQSRTRRVQEFVAGTPAAPDARRLTELDGRLRRLQEAERRRAQLRHDLDAYGLELRHFEKHVQPGDLSQLDRLPLLRRSADRILDYLVETDREENRSGGLVRRIRQYLKFGSLRGLDPSDTAVVLRLQRAFYDRRIDELTTQLAEVDGELSRGNFTALAEEHRLLSRQALHAVLGDRYRRSGTTVFTQANYRSRFTEFAAQHPVLLSTCHSLRANLPSGQLLDYLIVDEASQVSLLAAGAALASCRNLVVVGDLKQLPHIADDAAKGTVAPQPAYDYESHSLLASLSVLYGQALPKTLLREHYRCDPAIIGFCNKSFYGGDLVPFTQSGSGHAMVVRRTVEGNHMRQHTGGGRTNQREIDVINREVIPRECANVRPEDIGITTPYRRQANKVTQTLIEQIEADTVHRFQGRQKDVVIMTTVLDETWRGQTGLKFVDDPQLINVAVSRAAKKFVLVTNHDLLSKSRHVRDLIDYIGYQRLDQGVVDSAVVSVFDLLYREYSRRLRSLAGRLQSGSKYRSENIIWTVLVELLKEPPYEHLTIAPQVLVSNLFPDRSGLTEDQARYVGNRASVDFVVYNRVSNRPLLAIEVDGFKYHEDNPVQLARDALKNQIFEVYDLPLLRLPTTGSDEEARIRAALDAANAR
ncbi:AAA domain-containing protein [Kribbella italica]|uniref:DUF2726 domain-containing protein n=1 Tax=Kribbella italica TaxID=1540520 RepID=A0A7W9JFP0_9ACTN|nr:hypothetical protein [Kribbella italica]